VSLGCYPTPLVEAEHLSAVLGGPRILIKREDLSGLALGGNKCRKFEFLLADVKQRGFDSLLVDSVSNLSVQLVAAAAKIGIKVRHIVHGEVATGERQGNYVLHRILDSDFRVLEPISSTEAFDDVVARRNSALDGEARKLREEGCNPFIMRAFESTPIENAGWVAAVDEICQQLETQNIEAQYLVVTTSQGATHSGLAAGAKYLGTPFEVIGISGLHKRDRAISEVVRMSNETAGFLGLGIGIMPDEVTVYDEYVGDGYGKITEGGIEAIKLVAQTEGFFLDPVYTGKAMAGLVDLIRKGRFSSTDTVVFIHTGGIPALFAYHEEFTG